MEPRLSTSRSIGHGRIERVKNENHRTRIGTMQSAMRTDKTKKTSTNLNKFLAPSVRRSVRVGDERRLSIMGIEGQKALHRLHHSRSKKLLQNSETESFFEPVELPSELEKEKKTMNRPKSDEHTLQKLYPILTDSGKLFAGGSLNAQATAEYQFLTLPDLAKHVAEKTKTSSRRTTLQFAIDSTVPSHRLFRAAVVCLTDCEIMAASSGFNPSKEEVTAILSLFNSPYGGGIGSGPVVCGISYPELIRCDDICVYARKGACGVVIEKTGTHAIIGQYIEAMSLPLAVEGVTVIVKALKSEIGWMGTHPWAR